MAVFESVNRILEGPPLELELRFVRRARFVMDGFAGVPGKITLVINESKIPTDEDLTFNFIRLTLIHEVLHHKYPEEPESQIVSREKQKWAELYPNRSFPVSDNIAID